MRDTIRSSIKWLCLGLVTMLVFGVGGEWFIHVAEDKGWYQNAGKRWDSIMTSLASFFETMSAFVTSAPFLFAVTALTFLYLGLHADRFLKKKEQKIAENAGALGFALSAPSPSLTATETSAESLLKLIARRTLAIDTLSQLEEFSVKFEDAWTMRHRQYVDGKVHPENWWSHQILHIGGSLRTLGVEPSPFGGDPIATVLDGLSNSKMIKYISEWRSYQSFRQGVVVRRSQLQSEISQGDYALKRISE